MECQEFATVAFWDLDALTDQFNCTRFFIMPNPMKRTIQDVEDTQLDQVLFSSPHTKDVFFFFKGFEQGATAGDDLDDVVQKGYKLQIAFLNLVITYDEREMLGDSRYISEHCRSFHTISEGSVLDKIVHYLNDTPIGEQKQLPNPTIINPVNGGGKMVVFTAYMQEQFMSKDEWDGSDNKVSDCWYPTIFFYDIFSNKTRWEIFGAE